MNGQQLKNSILQMAVQGKLVPQDPNDEPASVLLERIRKEKEQLIKEGKIKKEKTPSFIFRGADNLPYEKIGKNEPVCIADEVPFDIPDTWEWVRLKNLVIKEIKRGKSPKYGNVSNVYVFAQKCNTKQGKIDISLAKLLVPEVFSKYPIEERMLNEDIVINSTGKGTLGRIGIFRDSDRINDFVIVPDSHVTIVRVSDYLDKEYLFYILKYYQTALEKLGEGSTNQTELKPSTIADLFMSVPPIHEQKRIVTKIKEVFPYVEKYELAYSETEKLNKAFPDLLKKSILQEAVQGKLVPQDPNDEPASVLLERIRAEKEQLIKEGKIKRNKQESIIFRRDNSHYEKRGTEEVCIDDELPFEIPHNWSWCRLQDIACVNGGYAFKSTDFSTEGVRVVRISDFNESGFVNTKIVRHKYEEKFKNFLLEEKNILLCMTGGTVGKSCFITRLSESMMTNQRVATIKIFGALEEYINLFILSPVVQEVIRNTKNSTNDNISIDTIKELFIPLPPYQEQVRIIAKYEVIMNRITKFS